MKPKRSKRKLLYVWIILGIVVGVPTLAYLAGMALPAHHTAQVSGTVSAPADEVWEALTNIDDMTRWRKEVTAIRRTESPTDLPRWEEESKFGKIPFQVLEMERPTKLINKIDDPKLPFGGTWTWELAPQGNATQITVTEDGHVGPPLFRFMSKFIFGHTATMKTYLRQLTDHVEGGRS